MILDRPTHSIRLLQTDRSEDRLWDKHLSSHPGGVLPYMGYIGMCRCEGHGFQAVYSRIGYINQRVWL